MFYFNFWRLSLYGSTLLTIILLYQCERCFAQITAQIVENGDLGEFNVDRGHYELLLGQEKHHLSVYMGFDLQEILLIPNRYREFDILPQQLDEMRILEAQAVAELDGLFQTAQQAANQGNLQRAIAIKDKMTARIFEYQAEIRKIMLPHQMQMFNQFRKQVIVQSLGFFQALQSGTLFDSPPTAEEREQIEKNLVKAQQFFDEELKRIEEKTIELLIVDLSPNQVASVRQFMNKAKRRYLLMPPKRIESTEGLRFYGGTPH
jgi:hypothetical protein